MEEYIYRYISFETFVAMIQNKSLTFVLPELWEDTHENKPFNQFLKSKEDIYEMMFYIACFYKTYGQCWTKLAESDAMWRIYSYGKRAIRIRVSVEKIKQLNNVEIVPVTYTDDSFVPENNDKDFLRSVSQKRIAFKHEEEIRLINYYKFVDGEDFTRHVKAILAMNSHPERVAIVESLFPGLDITEQIEETIRLLNLGKNKQTVKKIPFEHIVDFIAGVMVHPQSPKWYVEVVEEFCKRNNIHFDGQSKLYI